jgi:hypothetical protein
MLYKVRYRYHSQAESALELNDVAQTGNRAVVIH